MSLASQELDKSEAHARVSRPPGRGLRPRSASGALALVIGVSSGVATVGNIGGSERIQYTVIGDAVNVASRLVAIGEPGDIVIGEQTAISAGVEAAEIESRFVRGRKAPVRYTRMRTGTISTAEARVGPLGRGPLEPGAFMTDPEDDP